MPSTCFRRLGLTSSRSLIAVCLSVAAVLATARADTTVVFSELMYHPATNEAANEWIELHNSMSVDMDISGWEFTGGLDYVFPPETIIPGGAYVVVAANPEVMANVVPDRSLLFGPYSGRLDNGGESVRLRNNSGRRMDEVDYGDSGRWPVSPDGGGPSLAKLREISANDRSDFWAASTQIGGTPGAPNFPSADAPPTAPTGLEAYWNFDGAGSTVRDSAGSNDGEFGASTTRTAGLVGSGAGLFDNTVDALVAVGAGNAFTVSDGITIEAVIAPSWSAADGDQDMIFRKEDGSNRIVFGLQSDGNDDGRSDPPLGRVVPVLSFGLNIGGVYRELDVALDGADGRPPLSAFTSGEPHHVAATYDAASGLKAVWFDGVQVGAVQLTPDDEILSGGASTAYIGNMSGRRQGFTGTVDEVAFWSRDIGAQAVAAHASRSLAGNSYFSGPDIAPGETVPVAINEVDAAAATPWIELYNFGASPVDLDGYVLRSSGGGEWILPAGPLGAGTWRSLTTADFGFPLTPGDKLFLFTPEAGAVVDAASVEVEGQARLPDGTGRWFAATAATPGAAQRSRAPR